MGDSGRQEPWVNVRSASTTSPPKPSTIKRPRRARSQQRGAAAPHRLASRLGPRTPVTLTVTIRTGADVWAEVLTDQGRFYVAFDASVFDLVQQVIRGGHQVEPLSSQLGLAHRRGVAALNEGTPTEDEE